MNLLPTKLEWGTMAVHRLAAPDGHRIRIRYQSPYATVPTAFLLTDGEAQWLQEQLAGRHEMPLIPAVS